MDQFYDIPMDFAALVASKKRDKVDFSKSVKDHVKLILMTSMGESKFSKSFGSQIWDFDFDLAILDTGWNQEMKESMRRTIIENEPRIKPDFELELKVGKNTADRDDLREYFNIKLGNLKSKNTNEALEDIEFNLIFSPITID